MARRNLRDKLKERHGIGADAGPAEPATPPRAPAVRSGAGLRAYLQKRRAARLGPPPEPVDLPPGAEIENDRGVAWVRRLEYPLDDRHGTVPLAAAGRVDWSALAALAKDPDVGAAGLDECLFLDTETTGLSGGAGTNVFLTGVGFVDAGRLIVEQVFLRDFDEEPAALRHVARRLEERPRLVTFVGKAFDRHRLKTRMTLHRVESGVLDPRHLDLYYLARRAWGADLPDCRLRTLEERRLGVFRRGDLPGSEAPQAWLDWIRDRTGPVDRVLEHNRLDVLSLVTLLALLGAPGGR